MRTPTLADLQLELARQWLSAHADHCGEDAIPWPHDGQCHWPLPDVLVWLSPSEIYLLLLMASGARIGFQL